MRYINERKDFTENFDDLLKTRSSAEGTDLFNRKGSQEPCIFLDKMERYQLSVEKFKKK